MTRQYEASGFERFWNSTFGVPQQLIFRFLRAMQDDEVDILSEEGILDGALIPGLGIFDDNRHDVSSTEMVKRVGIEGKPSFGTELAVSMATDPLTFLTSGATALAKGGIAATKAARTASLSKVLSKAGVNSGELLLGKGTKLSTKEFLGHIDDALLNVTGPKAAKQQRILKKARHTLEGIDDGKGNIQDLLTKTKNTELRVGVPVLHNFGVGIAVTEKNKYWLGFLKSKVAETKSGKALGTLLSNDVASLPFMKGAIQRLSAAGDGLKYGRAATEQTTTSTLGSRGLELVEQRLTTEAGKLFAINEAKAARPLGAEFDSLIAGSSKHDPMDPKKAFLKVLLNRKGVDPRKVSVPRSKDALEGEFNRYASALFHVTDGKALPQITGESITKALGDFHSKYRVATSYFENSMSKLAPTAAGKAQAKAAAAGKKVFSWWTGGKKLSQAWGKVWKHGGKVEELDGPNQLAARLEAQTSSEMREIGDDLAELLAMDAKELGTDPDFLDKFFLQMEQGRPLMSEVSEFIKGVNAKGADTTRAAGAINNFISRLHRTIDSAGVQARGGKGNAKFKDLMDHVASRFSEEGYLKKVDFEAEYADAAFIPSVSERASITGPSVNRMTVRAGRYAGRFAGTLENEELLQAIEEAAGGAQNIRPKSDPVRMNAFIDSLTDDVRITTPTGYGESISTLIDDVISGNGFSKPKRAKYVASKRKLTKAVDYYSETGDKEGALDMLGIPFHVEDPDFGEYPHTQPYSRWQQKLLKNNEAYDNYVSAYDDASELLDYLDEVDFPTKYDLNKLTEADRSRFYRLDKLRRLREGGLPVAVAKGRAKIINPPRSNPQLTATMKGGIKRNEIEIRLNDFGYAIGQLQAAASEMKRAGHLGVGPSVIKSVEESLATIQGTWDDAISETLGESTRFLSYTRELRKRSFEAAAKQGSWHIGAPLAYVGRIFSRESRELLEKTLQDRGVTDALSSALPTLGSSMARSADNMTIEELNALHFALKSGPASERLAAKAFTDTLEKVAKSEGIKLSEDYTESLFLSAMARHSQALHGQGNIEYVGEALKVLDTTKTAMSGVIKGFVIGGAEEVAGKTTKSSARVRKMSTKLGQHEKSIIQQPTGIVLEKADGTTATIPMSFLTNDAYAGILLGKGHSDIATALGMRATRGALREGEQISRRLKPNDFEDLVGQSLFVGDRGAVNGVFDSMQTLWKGSNEAMVFVDSAQYMVKRFQTVYRPAFSLSNLASMFSQMSVIGLSGVDQLGGLADSMRWLGGNADVSRAYSKWNVHNAALRKTKIGGFLPKAGKNYELSFHSDIKGAGIDELLDLTPEEVIKQFPHLKHEDLIIDIGGQTLTQREILEAWRSTNMLGTFVSEGLRGGGSVSRTSMQIKAKALREATLLGKAGKAVAAPFKGAEKLAEGSEIAVRLAMFFGGVRSGKTLLQAAEDVKLAAVDYSNLTRPERFHLKRWFTYYTFPRHFLPVAGKHFAQNPAKMAAAAHLINDGPWREERGRLKFDFEIGDGDYSIDVTRMLPHLEALKVGETLGELFLDTGAMFSDQIERVQQKERLRQETPFTLTTGSIQQAAFAAVDGREETSSLSIMKDAFWISRFMFDGDDPLKEDTILTKLRKVAFPVSDRLREQETAMLRRRYRKLKAQLTDAATASDDPVEKQQFMAEIQYLALTVAQELREIQSP